jgi:hypothetical protein
MGYYWVISATQLSSLFKGTSRFWDQKQVNSPNYAKHKVEFNACSRAKLAATVKGRAIALAGARAAVVMQVGQYSVPVPVVVSPPPIG